MKQFVCISLALFATVAMAQPHGYHHSAPSYKHESSHKVHQVSLDELTKLIDVAAVEKLNGHAHHHYGKHSASYAPAKYVAPASAPTPGIVSKSYSHAPSAPNAHAHYHEAPAAYHEAPAAYHAAPATYHKTSETYHEAPATYHAAPAHHHSYAAPAHHHSYAAPAPKYEAAYKPAAYGAHSAHKPAAYGAHSAHKYAVLPAFVTQIHAGKNNYKTYQTPIQYSTVTLPVAPAGPVAKLYVPEHKHHGYEHHGYEHHGHEHKSYSGPSY